MIETAMAFMSGFLADRRQKAMLGLGFSQGIPYLLVYATQAAWLTEANVALGTLGILSELTLAYRLKFLWAPFLERYDMPILGAMLGRRRGWMVASQLGVVAGLIGIAVGNPATQLWWTIIVSVALGFCGATQDVVIDGWRIASVPTERQALMTSIAETGYRVGILVSGAGALILSDHIGWHGSYLVMAAMMLPGMAAALYAPEPEAVALPAPETSSPAETRDALVRLGEQDGRLAWVARVLLRFVAFQERSGLFARPTLVVIAVLLTILAPLIELVRRLRPMAIAILIMVAGFRMPGYISNAMAIPLFKHLHYSNTDIGTVTKLVGFWIAIAGVFAAGIVVTRIGIMASLVIGTIAGSASHLALAYLAAYGAGGHDYWAFAIAVGIDGFAASFAQIVLITYMSSIASNAFAGSQFGMLTSLVALPGSVLTVGSGFAAGYLGFPLFFTMTALIGLPIAILTVWVWHVEGGRGLSAAHRAPMADAGLTAKEAPASGAP